MAATSTNKISSCFDKNITLPYNFKARGYQFPFLRYMDNTPIKQRAFLMQHRRCGKDLLAWVNMIKKAHERVGTYWHMLPFQTQAKKIIWNGTTKEGKAFLSFVPPDSIANILNNEMTIKLKNGSIIQLVGADKVDSLVGANPIGVNFSEFALMKPSVWHFISPILTENDGWAVFITTPRGKNHAYDMFKSLSNNPNGFAQLLTIADTKRHLLDPVSKEPLKNANGDKILVPITTENDLNELRDTGIPEEIIQQEYFCSFEAGKVGAYYAELMARIAEKGHLHDKLYNDQYPVYTAWDLGLSDAMAIIYFQHYDDKIHIVEYNEFVGRSLIECCYIVQGDFKSLEDKCGWDDLKIQKAMAQYYHHAHYKYRDHFAPHDIKVREMTTGLSRIDVARTHGIVFKQVPKGDVQDSINLCRRFLLKTHFDKTNSDLLIQALKAYRKKWDEANRVYANEPLHDWSSHACDSLKYTCGAVLAYIDFTFLDTTTSIEFKHDPFADLVKQHKKNSSLPGQEDTTQYVDTDYNTLDLANY